MKDNQKPRSDGVLRRRVAVVTGASSGIGRGVALAMAAAGAAVVLVGRDRGRLEQAADAIRQRGGAGDIVVADLVEDGVAEQIVEAARALHSGIDVLVNAAGICLREPVDGGTVETLDAQWRINVRAPYALSLAALPSLRPGGSIIFLSSVAAQVPMADLSAYAATKAAVAALGRTMAVELARRDVRVNTIAPGFVATEMNEQLRQDPGRAERAIAATPAGRLGSPEDIADVAVFLASDAARFVHGAVLPVTGGYPMPFGDRTSVARDAALTGRVAR